MTFSARQWRKIWEQLYNSGEMNLSGRIAHDVGHIWNGDNWDEQVSIDFSAETFDEVRDAADKAGVLVNW